MPAKHSSGTYFYARKITSGGLEAQKQKRMIAVAEDLVIEEHVSAGLEIPNGLEATSGNSTTNRTVAEEC
ncbi:MAG: hypothetical protein AB8B74_03285 [Crocinitomicaceae bacterium]